MLKAKELKDQSIADLEASHILLRNELFQLVNSLKKEKKLEKPHRIPQAKKDIARLLTVLHAKRSAQKTGKGA